MLSAADSCSIEESDDEEEASEDEDEGWEDIEVNADHPIPEDRWTAFVYGDSGTEWKEPFRYKDNLPPYYMAQVSLMHILTQHKTNDLGLFNRVMKWVWH